MNTDLTNLLQIQRELCNMLPLHKEPEPELATLDDSAVFGYLMTHSDKIYNAMHCHDCKGWTVFVVFDSAPEDSRIAYSSCKHDDVCPDCNTDLHPGCCGPHS